MENSTQPQVFCLGEILYDLLSDNPGLSIKEVKSWTPYMGGAPANVAFGLSKLGIPVGFIGKVGRDKIGEDLVKSLQIQNINIEGIQWEEKAPTRQVYVERNLLGDRKFAGFGNYHTSEFADTKLDWAQIPYFRIQKCKYLVLGTLLLAYPESRKALEKVMNFCSENQIDLILDINWREVFWEDQKKGIESILSHIHKAAAVKFSKEEAELLYGTHEIAQIKSYLSQTRIILITDGDKGCHYSIMGHTGFVPSFRVEAIDTTGAGDSFLAGFIYQLIENDSSPLLSEYQVHYMVKFASAMGALTTTGGGAILPQPYLPQVLDFLKTYLTP